MINETLLITGLALAVYPIASIMKLIVNEKNQGLKKKVMASEKIDDMIDEMIDNISNICGVNKELLLSPSRKREIAIPRQILTYFLIYKFNIGMYVPLYKIGLVLNRHHATLIYSKKSVEMGLEVNDKLILGLFNNVYNSLSHKDKQYYNVKHNTNQL